MKKFNFEEAILFETDDYIIINKPPFVSTLDDRVNTDRQNILTEARTYWADIQVAHRLDRETSGALALAKNPDAYRNLAMQFEKRKVNKIYHALVDGLHDFAQTHVNRAILPLTKGIVKIDDRSGKPAETYFQTLEVFKKHTLVECRPLTGRMHQIRIHLALLKASISGDEQYGGKPFYLSEIKKNYNLKKNTEEQPLIPRFALHAFQLEFQSLQNEKISVEAPYPKDIRAALNQLRKNS